MTTTTTTTAAPHPSRHETCDPSGAVTRSLLGYGVIAGPLYVAVSLAQAVTREGFDLTRHAWSLLANGSLGWVQSVNLVLTGAMFVAFAIGLRTALRPGSGARWAPVVLAGYGLSVIAGGVFRADPVAGFPVGTSADQATVTLEGTLHLAAGGLGFAALVAALMVLARRFAAEGSRAMAAVSRVVATALLLSFVAMASGAGGTAAHLAFTAAIIAAMAWTSAVAVDRYRRHVTTGAR